MPAIKLEDKIKEILYSTAKEFTYAPVDKSLLKEFEIHRIKSAIIELAKVLDNHIKTK